MNAGEVSECDPETVLAFLEECGYRRDQIGKLTRRYIREVLQHPRDGKTGRLIVKTQEADHKPRDPWDLTRRMLAMRGYRPHQVEVKVRELKAREKAMKQMAADCERAAQEEAAAMVKKIRETMRK